MTTMMIYDAGLNQYASTENQGIYRACLDID